MDCNKNEHCSWLRAQDVLFTEEQKKYESLLSTILAILHGEDEQIRSLVHQEIDEINTNLFKEISSGQQIRHSKDPDRFEALWKSAREEHSSFLPGFLQKDC